MTTEQLLILGIGTTLSVAPGALALIPFARRVMHYRPKLDLSHPSIAKLMRIAVYLVGYVGATQLGYVIIQWLANKQQGGYSAFIAAMTFFLVPIGVFEWSLTTALLPGLSEAAVHKRWTDFRAQLSIGARALLFLIVPSAVGLFVLAKPLVEVLLEHGIVTETSSVLVSDVLKILSLGLVQFALFLMLVRAFYALQDTRTPFLVNVLVIGLNVAIVIPMFRWYGVQGLAAGQAISYAVGAFLLGRILAPRSGGLDVARIVRSAGRIAVASAVMGGALWLCLGPLENLDGSPLLVRVGGVILASALGLMAYLGTARVVRVEELAFVRALIARDRETEVSG